MRSIRIRPTVRVFAAAVAGSLALAGASPAQEEATDEPVAPANLPLEVEVEKADFAAMEKARMVIAYRDRLGKRVQRYLEKAGELAEEDKPKEAEALLLKIQESRLNAFESAYVYRLLGFVAYGNSQPEEAIHYFRKAVDVKALQVKEESRMRYAMGQLYVGIGKWPEAIFAFKDWMRYTQEPDPTGYFIQGIAYFQLKKYDAAIAHVEKAIEISPKPQESWLKLLAALHAEKQDFPKAVPVLQELLLRFPSKQYWIQLALINAATESYDVSLAVQQMAYQQGYLTETKELMRLAQGYVYHGLPYPAATMLEKELKAGRLEESPEHYEMLANSWIGAREYDRALPPLQKAAQLADSGTFYVRLGQVHMQREEWGSAAKYLAKALSKGDLGEKQGSAQVLLGISLYNDGQLVAAQNSFQRAARHDRNRVEAERWITHITKELAQAA